MGQLITVEELPRYAPGELKLDSTPVGRNDFRLRIFRYGPSDIWVPPSENYLIVIYRDGTTSMNRRVTGAWKQDHVGRGVTTLLTRAEPSNWRWQHDIEVSHFYISPTLMTKTASEAFDRDAETVELHDLLKVEDPMLSWINDQMVQEVAAGGPGGRLCYDALALQASVHILRKYAAIEFKMPCAQGRFRPAHARLIEDYVEQNIFRNITLEELANICNCTPVQFARKFRVHYGMRPHAYVLRRKVEHACQHLRKDRVALKEIALLAGFADQSHLNRVFRQHMNVTPAEYRRQVCETKHEA
ncbi:MULTISPECIES: AraC family transcriptional regulator [Bradyrhizobium]|uniref:helix-turn-helix transcriptional regulator n=1 Tax=Bradyrhizobium TaxID=374 RepID=UPI0003F9D949|nr:MULTISPECIES: AraC family transcriptional regulator [Bradyrhizobium]KIU51414.1 AraC family transcriptional regulator [Bradyrhizobium elkanii]MBK5655826.1 helix-turn-helix transcriptional regulator [Rhizobium sp.]OCX31540.1 AraC family transcriptional regulator [Bradyrhizobium sp. UASWS1016]